MANKAKARKKFAKIHRSNNGKSCKPQCSANIKSSQEHLMQTYAFNIILPTAFISSNHTAAHNRIFSYLMQHKYMMNQLAEQLLNYGLELAVHQDTAYARKCIMDAKVVWDCTSTKLKAAEYLLIPDTIITRCTEAVYTAYERAIVEGGNSHGDNVVYTNSLNCVKLLSFLNCIFD